MLLMYSIDVAQALTAVKFLGKDVSGSECISSPKNLSTLLELAFKEDQEVSNEALRCIANALLLVEQTRDIFTQKEVDGGIITASLLEVSFVPQYTVRTDALAPEIIYT